MKRSTNSDPESAKKVKKSKKTVIQKNNNGIEKNKNKSSNNKIKKIGKNKSKKNSIAQKVNAFYVVPWLDNADWDRTCRLFKEGSYDEVIRELSIWRERLPALPVGAESTLALLEAILFDRSDPSHASENQSRSLYSLAVVRYMNQVSHLATQETGGAPMARLASHANVPDWIVDLRHDVSHGSALPSLEVLRCASDFMLEWLGDNYWAYSDDSLQESILTRKQKRKSENDLNNLKEEISVSAGQAISTYIASKVYKLRGLKRITDPEITNFLPNQPFSVTPKHALGVCKTQIANLLTIDPTTLVAVFAQELIPNDEFIVGLASIMGTEPDEQVFLYLESLWLPLIELMKRRGKIPVLCTLVTKLLVSQDLLNKNGKFYGAMWLDKLLSLLEEEDKKYPLRLKKVLTVLMASPDPCYDKFFPRLLRLLENNLGTQKVEQLQALFSIWTDTQVCDNVLGTDLITVDDLTGGSSRKGKNNNKDVGSNFSRVFLNANSSINPLQCWQLDSHGQNYWRKLPLGSTIKGDLLD